jgi:hypothetical protein
MRNSQSLLAAINADCEAIKAGQHLGSLLG